MGRKRRTNNSNCVVVHATLADGVIDRDVLDSLCAGRVRELSSRYVYGNGKRNVA